MCELKKALTSASKRGIVLAWSWFPKGTEQRLPRILDPCRATLPQRHHADTNLSPHPLLSLLRKDLFGLQRPLESLESFLMSLSGKLGRVLEKTICDCISAHPEKRGTEGKHLNQSRWVPNRCFSGPFMPTTHAVT